MDRPKNARDWRIGACRACGHGWQVRYEAQWFCARCEWPPVQIPAAVLRARLVAWIDAEMARRDGHGSYAKGQRWLLRLFRDEVTKP